MRQFAHTVDAKYLFGPLYNQTVPEVLVAPECTFWLASEFDCAFMPTQTNWSFWANKFEFDYSGMKAP